MRWLAPCFGIASGLLSSGYVHRGAGVAPAFLGLGIALVALVSIAQRTPTTTTSHDDAMLVLLVLL